MKNLSQGPNTSSVAINKLLCKEIVEQENPAAVASVMEMSSKRNAEIAGIISTFVLEYAFQDFIDFPYLQTGVKVGKLEISQEK